MKKIIFSILFLSLTLFADTLVVDGNATCTSNGLLPSQTCTSCKGDSSYYETISEALDNASAGDIIEICKDTYEESVDVDVENLTIKGVDGQNVDDVEIKKNGSYVVKIKVASSNKTVIQNLKVTSDSSSGIAIWGDGNSNGNIVLKDLIVQSDNKGLYFDEGFSELKNVTIDSKDMAVNAIPTTNIVIDNVDINSSDDMGIYFGSGDDNIEISISNSKIVSSNNAIRVDKAENFDLSTTYIKSSSEDSIVLSGNVGSFKIHNSLLESEGSGKYVFLNDGANGQDGDVFDNCFYGDKLIYDYYGDYSGNYYDGVSDENDNGKIDSDDSNKLDGNMEDSNYCTSCSSTPIAEYRMDECYWDGTAGEVKDSIGGYDGTTINGANTGYGNLCMAGEFSGDNYIDTGHDFHWKRDDNFSIAVWVNVKDVDEYEYIPIFGKLNRYGDYSLMIGKRVKFIYRAEGGGGGLNVWNTQTNIESGKWYFIVFTYNGETKEPKLYINGNEETYVYENDSSKEFRHENSEGSLIGSGFAWGGSFFKGKIDELKIYDKSLCPGEISKIYQNEKYGKNYDGSERSCSNCLPKPLANYRLDECKWGGFEGEIKDSTLKGNDGTLVNIDANTLSSSTAGGGQCQVGEFNASGADIDGLNVSTSSGDKTTVSFWIYWDETDNVMPFGWDEYALYFKSGDFGFTTGENDIYGIDSASLKNSWHHVVAIFNNGDYEDSELYIDGNKQSLSQQQGNQNKNNAYADTSARIGGWRSDDSYLFSGKLDEIKIFKGGLTDQQIQTIYDNENSGENFDGGSRACASCDPKIVLDYRMDECFWDGTEGEVGDYSGNEYNGTVVYEANTDIGKLCNGGKFDGEEDYIDTNQSFTWSRDENFSITVWVNIADVSEYEFIPILAKQNQEEYSLMVGRGVRFIYRDSIYIWNAKTKLESNKWYFIAVTHNGETKEPKIYINGKDETHIYTNYKNKDLGSTDDHTLIASGFAWGHQYFKGMIDEVKIYDSALDSSWIRYMYHNEESNISYDGSARTCANCLPEPIVNYRLDERVWVGVNGEVKDSGVNYLNGIAEDGALVVEGKLCNAGLFDGIDDDIRVEHNDKFNSTNNSYTIMAWVKTYDENQSALIVTKGGDEGHSIGQDENDGWYVKFSFDDDSDKTVDWDDGKPETNRWYHIAGVWDGENSEIRIYVDGDFANSFNFFPFENNKNLENNSEPFFIDYNSFNGEIDEVKVFDSALIDEQVSSIEGNESNGSNYDSSLRVCRNCELNIQLDYRMDECSWSDGIGVVKDSSPNKYDGDAVDGADVADGGWINRSGDFNATYVDIKHDFHWKRNDSFTIMAWFYPRQENCGIFAKESGKEYDLIYSDQKRFIFSYKGEDAHDTIYIQIYMI